MIRAFARAPSGIVGMVAIGLILLVSIVAPILLADQSTTFDILSANQNASAHHWLGTDRLGRDILARIIVATRLSIGLAFIATAIGTVLGFSVGSVAAILPPRVRPFALRMIDTLLAFPPILVAIFVGAIIGPGAVGATVGVGIAISFQLARVASTLALSVGGREYIAAAKVVGVKGPQLFLRYILPNIAETLFAESPLGCLAEEDGARPVQKGRAHHEPLFHAVRETFDQLVLPSRELEELEHVVHALIHTGVIDAVESRVKPKEFSRRELLVDVRPIGNETQRRLGAFRILREIVAVHEDAPGGRLQ